MEIVIIVSTALADSVLMETNKLRIPLEPIPAASNSTRKYYRLWVKETAETEEVCTEVIQILMAMPGVVVAYCKPTVDTKGWKVQEP